MKFKYAVLLLILATFIMAFGCGKKPPPPPPEQPKVVVDTTTPPPPEPPPPPPPKPELILTAIHFDFDKADLRSDARDIMAQNAKSLADNPDARIRVAGHCDERGTEEYNMALGERRANAARDYLVNYGIDAAKVSTISYGESRPVDMGHSEDAWSKNRRDEFEIISR